MKYFLLTALVALSLPTYARVKATPEYFIVSCFTDYLSAFSKTGKESIKQSEKIREKCLSKDYLKNWNKLVQKTDADAWLHAQDYQETWLTTIKIKNIDKTNHFAQILIGSEKEQHCLDVKYTDNNGKFKIASSVVCKPN